MDSWPGSDRLSAVRRARRAPVGLLLLLAPAAIAALVLPLVQAQGNPRPAQGQEKTERPESSLGWRRPVVVPGRAKPHCTTCEDQGWRWCTKHSKAEREMVDGVPFCSVTADCPACGGTLRVDCPTCDNKLAQEWLEKERARQAEWLAERRNKLDVLVRRKLMHAASPRFQLTFDVPRLKVGRRTLDQHELMHLYLDRLEALYASFKMVMTCSDREFNPPIQICIWNGISDNARVSPHLTGTGGSGGTGSKLLGPQPVFTMARDRGTQSDEDLHRCVVHNTTHLLLSNLAPYVWVGQRKAGWLDEGLAHYFEFLLDGRCTNFCYTEQNTLVGFRGGKWRAFLRGRVQLGAELPSFISFYNKLIDELSPLEHALSFSYVEFLLSAYGGAKLKALTLGIKEKKEQRDLFRDIYELSVMAVEEKWRAHVLATYPVRD